ncbi:hypothetical protein HY792_03560 [Candidatus Desantisbacteria bacterium]|nr:hypothetical protein [Candidatus Desantisbacteria bacterium]
MQSLRQQVKVNTGLFISKEMLAKINVSEEIEMEFIDREIRIHPITKKIGKKADEVWQSAKGSWRNHPVFGNMKTKEIVEWIRGSDSDV